MSCRGLSYYTALSLLVNCRGIDMSSQPLKCGVRVKGVYFYSEVELAVVWHKASEDTHLDEHKRRR